jgi:hypothetical protein
MTNVTIATASGPLTGTLSGRDPDRREVQIAVRRETAPAWFQSRYKSRVVFLWVRESEVKND